MSLEPILAVWGGLYLDGEIISEANLEPYIDDVLNELEFLLVYTAIPIPDQYYF
jgi:alpha-N-arabinofuranosidase